MKTLIGISMAALVIAASPALAQQQSQGQQPQAQQPQAQQPRGQESRAQRAEERRDQHFMTQAIEGNFAEVKMGQLAQQKGATDDVKSFGKTLVDDHGKANDAAMKTAKDIGMNNPPSGPSKTQTTAHDKLAKLSGQAFDRAFARDMVRDHKKDIAEYERAAKESSPVGQYAKDQLPVLRKHLQMAEKIESSGATAQRRTPETRGQRQR